MGRQAAIDLTCPKRPGHRPGACVGVLRAQLLLLHRAQRGGLGVHAAAQLQARDAGVPECGRDLGGGGGGWATPAPGCF